MKPKKENDVKNYFDQIDKLFDELGEQKKKELENAQIKPIHQLFPYAQNGICAFIATMGSGKSYQFTKLMAKQQGIFSQPFFELIVYCSTSDKFDITVETFKKTINKSKLVAVKDVDLLAFLNKYMKRVLKYNSINKLVDSGFKEVNEEMSRLIAKHSLKNPTNKPVNRREKDKLIEYISKKLLKYNWSTHPHRMLLILDDFASHPLMRSKETELSRLLKKLRHFNINVIICVQTTKSIPKDIKRVLHDCVLFPGISEDDFNELIKEGPFGRFDKKQLWNAYKSLNDPHDMFTIHISANRVIITPHQKNKN